MLEISLSAVAAFAAYTVYAIAGDELKANKAGTYRQQKPVKQIKDNKVVSSAKAKAPVKTINAGGKAKYEVTQTAAAPTNPNTLAAESILDYIKAKGPATYKKLGRELQLTDETVQSASELLLTGHFVVQVKRGGHPGLAIAN
jgi:hypothetical protein